MTHKPALLASVALTILLALVTATRWSSLVSSRSSPAPGEQTVTTSATATEATTAADSVSDAVSRTGLSLADLPSTGPAVFQPIDPTPPSASDDDGWDDDDDEHEDDHDWSDDDHDDDDDQEQDDDDD